MIAALDATPLTLSSGGLKRYVAELHAALCREFSEDAFHLLSDQLQPPENWLDRRWWSIGLPRALRRLGAGVFHGTDFAVPYRRVCASVMTIHDCSPWMDAAWHHSAGRVRRRTPLLIRAGLPSMIIVPTEAVKRQVVQLFRIPPSRVAAVPEAAAPHLKRVDAPPPARPYFLFVGTLEPRKNIRALVAAWRQVRARYDVDLVIAGRRRADGPVLVPGDGLMVRGEVAEDELARLYSGAAALVYPSHYEGFGLPVVEAMQCGTAVIASRDPALMEVSGGAAVHVTDVDLPAAMERLLVDPAERACRTERSLARAKDFSWQRTARLTREVYAEAMRRFRG